MPATPNDLDTFLATDTLLADLLRRIDGCFAPGEAVAEGLPLVDASTAFAATPVENSVAARHAAHPVMRHVETTHGRGPLWRVMGRAYDLEACLTDDLPKANAPQDGAALVPATRGLYAVTARHSGGRVTAFARVTPTDHLLAKGGMLDRTLATLPAEKHGLAPLVMDILDPCSPIRLREVRHA